MKCDWKNRTLELLDRGKNIKLSGLQKQPLQVTSISAKVYNSTEGNDVCAFVHLDHQQDELSPIHCTQEQTPPQSNRYCISTRMSSMTHKLFHHKEVMTIQFPYYLVQAMSTQSHTAILHNTRLRLKIKSSSSYRQTSLPIVTAPLHLMCC